MNNIDDDTIQKAADALNINENALIKIETLLEAIEDKDTRAMHATMVNALDPADRQKLRSPLFPFKNAISDFKNNYIVNRQFREQNPISSTINAIPSTMKDIGYRMDAREVADYDQNELNKLADYNYEDNKKYNENNGYVTPSRKLWDKDSKNIAYRTFFKK